MTASQRSIQLENRLIDFAVRIVKLSGSLGNSYREQHFGKQIVRSGSAPALLYGEARGAESQKDFKHKLGIALKELRETHINLRIIERANFIPAVQLVDIIDEANQLISIFVTTVRSVDKNLQNKRSK